MTGALLGFGETDSGVESGVGSLKKEERMAWVKKGGGSGRGFLYARFDASEK